MKRAASLNKVSWGDRGWLPAYYGFCPNERAWKTEMKRVKLDLPYPTTDGRCTSYKQFGRDLCCVVTIGERLDKKARRDPVSHMALIAHEAMHVWRRIREEIGEAEPSSEFEAYALQNIIIHLGAAYERTRVPLGSRRARKPAAKSRRRSKRRRS